MIIKTLINYISLTTDLKHIGQYNSSIIVLKHINNIIQITETK